MRAEDTQRFDELLVEMTYAWTDIEQQLSGTGLPEVCTAFRVEAREDANDFGDPYPEYDLLFDAEEPAARQAAQQVRAASDIIHSTIRHYVEMWDRRYSHRVRVVPRS